MTYYIPPIYAISKQSPDSAGQTIDLGVSEAKKQQIRKRIGTARLTVASFCRFFGHLIGKTRVVIAEPHHNVKTAAVSPDGYTYWNTDYVDKLSDAELAGLVVHETLHPALLCWRRQGSRKAMCVSPTGQIFSLWNLSHDLSFNPEIIALAAKCRARGKIALPKFAAVEVKYEGWSAERIYDDKLRTMKKSKTPLPGGAVGTLSGPGVPGCGGEEGEIGDDLRPDLSGSDVGKKAAKGDKAAIAKLANDWKVSVIAAAMAHERKHGRGHLPGGIAKLVAELQECKVDWRDVLSQWIGENGNRLDFTFRRPRRRFDGNVLYLPSYQKWGIDDVVVLWDTSGSMNGRETDILSEIQAICEDLGLVLRIICIDTAIHADIRDVKEAVDMIGNIKGGGGSDFTPAFDLLEEEQFNGVVVAFTDGMIGVPDLQPPLIKGVLWCIEPTGSDRDPTEGRWGQVLLMED